MLKGLKEILDEVPILLTDNILWHDKDYFYRAEAVAVRNKRKNIRYTAMNYNCDHLAETLLHETLHHYYPTAEEKDVEIFTHCLWKKPEYKKEFQNKIVEVLSDYDL